MHEAELEALTRFAEESAIQIGALTALVKALAMTLTSAQREEARRLLELSSASTNGAAKTKLRQELDRMRELLL